MQEPSTTDLGIVAGSEPSSPLPSVPNLILSPPPPPLGPPPELAVSTPPTSPNLQPIPLHPTIPSVTIRIPPRKRLRSPEVEENICHDDGCCRLIVANDLITCKGPACGGVVRVPSQSLLSLRYISNLFICSFTLHV